MSICKYHAEKLFITSKKKKKETFTSIKSMQTDFMAQNLTLRAMAPISAGHQRKETESETAP